MCLCCWRSINYAVLLCFPTRSYFSPGQSAAALDLTLNSQLVGAEVSHGSSFVGGHFVLTKMRWKCCWTAPDAREWLSPGSPATFSSWQRFLQHSQYSYHTIHSLCEVTHFVSCLPSCPNGEPEPTRRPCDAFTQQKWTTDTLSHTRTHMQIQVYVQEDTGKERKVKNTKINWRLHQLITRSISCIERRGH